MRPVGREATPEPLYSLIPFGDHSAHQEVRPEAWTQQGARRAQFWGDLKSFLAKAQSMLTQLASMSDP